MSLGRVAETFRHVGPMTMVSIPFIGSPILSSGPTACAMCLYNARVCCRRSHAASSGELVDSRELVSRNRSE